MMTPSFWPKTSSSRADLTQIACMHGCRLLQKPSKVKIGSRERSRKSGMGIIHAFFIQTHHLLPSWTPNLAQNDQIWGYSGPNNMCTLLQTAEEAFQSQNLSQARVMMTRIGIVHGILSQPQHFLPSWPPLLDKNEQLHGWFGQNDMCKWLQNAAEALRSLDWFMNNVYKGWDIAFSSNHTI